MKLLLCRACQDVQKLQSFARTCKCGKSGGRYVDDVDAEYWGKDALLLGFGNNSLADAILGDAWKDPARELGVRFDAFVIPCSAPSIDEVAEPTVPAPKWADGHLYVDEFALLGRGVDWENPLHVLLLRLAKERSMCNYLRACAPRDPQPPLSEETLARVRERLEDPVAIAAREKSMACTHDWRINENSPMKFPQLRCPKCGCGTDFKGALWDGAVGRDIDMNGPRKP